MAVKEQSLRLPASKYYRWRQKELDTAEEKRINKKIEGSDYTGLEENLLRLSDYYLSASKLRYDDDIVETLKSLYCIKEVEPEEAKRRESGFSFLRHPLALVGRIRSRGRYFLGIDGEYYRESDFVNWSRARPLLVKLQEQIKKGEFSQDWGQSKCAEEKDSCRASAC